MSQEAPTTKPQMTSNTSSSSQSDPLSRFEIAEELGKGSYGGVMKAHDKSTGSDVAIKIIPIETDNYKEVAREVSILKRCKSKYIVNYLGGYRTKDEIWIVMEYCDGGSISDIIGATKQALAERELACVVKDTLKGLSYLHKNKLIHRDIKAGNVLLHKSGYCKLADFGVSAQLQQTISRRNTVIGSPYWMAPEVLQQNTYDSKADIWSLGITIIEMAEGRPPLMDMHPLRALLQIPKRPPPRLNPNGEWSDKLISFLELCLVKDPSKRGTAQELLNHEFIKSAGKRSIIRNYLEKTMPSIEKYRKEKNWQTETGTGTAQFQDEENNNNDDIANDDNDSKTDNSNASNTNTNNNNNKTSSNSSRNKNASKNIYESKSNNNNNNNNNNGSTMIVQDDSNKSGGNYDYGRSLINPNRKPLSQLDPRSPEYIVRPLFEERTPIFRDFKLEDYLPDNPTKEDVKKLRQAVWHSYWKDKIVIDDYYIECRRQIRALLDDLRDKKKNGNDDSTP